MTSSIAPPSTCDLNAPGHIDHLNVTIFKDEIKFARELPLWDNGSEITVSFLDGTPTQKALVEDIFKEYSAFANVGFNFLQNVDNKAHIRISFAGAITWSSPGRNALELKGGPTMAFGGNGGLDRTIVRHHVGHALGLEHHWYAKLADGVEDTSIMNYFIGSPHTLPATDSEAKLSKSDKAWLVINYPGKSGGNLENAFKTLKIPFEPAFRANPRRGYADFTSAKSQEALRGILVAALESLESKPAESSEPKVAYSAPANQDDSDKESGDDSDGESADDNDEDEDPGDDDSADFKSFDDELRSARSETDFNNLLNKYSESKKRAEIEQKMYQVVPEKINEKYLLWAVMLHPKFRQGIANIVEGRLRREHKMNLPLAVQQGVWDSVWRVATSTLGDILTQHSISPNNLALAAANPPPDPEVQQSIITALLSVLFDVAPNGYYYPTEGKAPPLPQHSLWNSGWMKQLGKIGVTVAKNTVEELSK